MAEMKRGRVSDASVTDVRSADTAVLEKTIRERLEYPHHRHALLEESGISPAVVAGRGYRTATTKTELAELGFSGKQRLTPALVVPMYCPAGQLVTHQIRPDAPRENGDGKVIKYETPAGSPVRLDVHPSQTERIRDASVPLWIIEGVKKADSLVSRGQCAVALQGVWCWRGDGVPLADWEDVRLHGRARCAWPSTRTL